MGDKVFLSYAASDRHRIESAIAQFPGLRMADSLESELRPGDDVRAIIRDRVQSANEVVVFWSEAAATSQYVQYELGMADALAGCRSEMPEALSSKHFSFKASTTRMHTAYGFSIICPTGC
jgi:TIR domain